MAAMGILLDLWWYRGSKGCNSESGGWLEWG